MITLSGSTVINIPTVNWYTLIVSFSIIVKRVREERRREGARNKPRPLGTNIPSGCANNMIQEVSDTKRVWSKCIGSGNITSNRYVTRQLVLQMMG